MKGGSPLGDNFFDAFDFVSHDHGTQVGKTVDLDFHRRQRTPLVGGVSAGNCSSSVRRASHKLPLVTPTFPCLPSTLVSHEDRAM